MTTQLQPTVGPVGLEPTTNGLKAPPGDVADQGEPSEIKGFSRVEIPA